MTPSDAYQALGLFRFAWKGIVSAWKWLGMPKSDKLTGHRSSKKEGNIFFLVKTSSFTFSLSRSFSEIIDTDGTNPKAALDRIDLSEDVSSRAAKPTLPVLRDFRESKAELKGDSSPIA